MLGIKPNNESWPSATFGTIRGFFLLGIALGFGLGFVACYWIYVV